MIIDSHIHFGPGLRYFNDPVGPLLAIHSADDLLHVMDRAEIDVGVICPPRWIGGEVFDPNYEQANVAIAHAVKKHPDRLIGFGRVNPNWGADAVKEVRRCLGTYGLRGIKLDAEWESFFPNNRTLVWPLLNLAVEYKVPVLFYTGYYPAEPALLIELALEFPSLPIIVGHMGGRLTSDAIIAARKAPNLILETSGSLYSFWGAIKGLGTERFIFGSNCPFEFPQVQLEKFRLAPELTREDLGKIFSENAAKLFGLKVPSGGKA
jgi:predicted TIM-barrel fold metal-dependent hydrolase